MSRTSFALTVGACLALTTAATSAGELSYESRGYGGPLYVGPNFKEGGQNAPPVYGPKSSSERSYSNPSPTKRARTNKTRNEPVTREAVTPKTSPAKSEETAAKATAEVESSSIAGAPAQDSKPTQIDAAAVGTKGEPDSDAKKPPEFENSTITNAGLSETAAKPTTCKRFIAEVGKTVDVACD